MKRVILEPTFENLILTLKENKLKMDNEIGEFIKFLDRIEGAYNVVLDGRWGTGKTFFIKHTKLVMDYISEQYKEIYDHEDQIQIEKLISEIPNFKQIASGDWRTVYFDAWEHDNDSDPIGSLAYELSLCGNGVNTEGIEIAGIITALIKSKENLDLYNIISKDYYVEEVKKEKNIKKNIEKKIDDIIGEVSERIIIFVDELDRCNPEYAVRLLERVKHYFNHEKIIFVFVINLEQIQHTIKAYYGEGFNANKYLDKLFDFEIKMPEIDYSSYLREWTLPEIKSMPMILRELTKNFKFSIREINKFIEQINHIADKIEDFGFQGAELDIFLAHYIIPFLCGMKIYDRSSYDEVMKGNGFVYIEKFILTGQLLRNIKLYFGEKDDESIKNIIEAIYSEIFSEEDDYDYGEVVIGGRSYEKRILKQEKKMMENVLNGKYV